MRSLKLPLLVLLAAFRVANPAMADDDQSGNGYGQHGDHHNEASHIEGHIAFLKTELGITPAQEALWNPVAAAMRADVKEFEVAVQQMASYRTAPPTAVNDLEGRATFSSLRATSERRFLDAFRPLYESLSPEQKQAADNLFINREER
jgi:hypothetical protein